MSAREVGIKRALLRGGTDAAYASNTSWIITTGDEPFGKASTGRLSGVGSTLIFPISIITWSEELRLRHDSAPQRNDLLDQASTVRKAVDGEHS